MVWPIPGVPLHSPQSSKAFAPPANPLSQYRLISAPTHSTPHRALSWEPKIRENCQFHNTLTVRKCHECSWGVRGQVRGRLGTVQGDYLGAKRCGWRHSALTITPHAKLNSIPTFRALCASVVNPLRSSGRISVSVKIRWQMTGQVTITEGRRSEGSRFDKLKPPKK
jgi:hypothetical protein